MIPFVLVRDAEGSGQSWIAYAGVDPAGLVGFDPVRLELIAYEPADVVALVNVEPAAVFYGVSLDWAEETERMVANRRPRYAPKGIRFQSLPKGAVSGFPVAERTIRRHRMYVPNTDTIRVSALFAVSTVRTRIEQAEETFQCFGELYRQSGRQMPDLVRLRDCFVGLQNTKTAVFAAVAKYADTMRQAMASGYRDRELRRVLATESEVPEGLGLAKLSFTLALLGQDTVCLDARLLNVMFPRVMDRQRFEKAIAKYKGRITPKALTAYEEAEDAFLAENPHYDATDPIGRARAQWMSWEGVGGKGAEHRVWLNLLPITP